MSGWMLVSAIAISYALSGVAAYYLIKRDWLRKFDFTVGDRRMTLGFSCLGPLALTVAIIFEAGRSIGKGLSDPNRVIHPRKRK